MIPDKFKIVGVTRQSDLDIESLLKNTNNKDYLLDNTELFEMDLDKEEGYFKLKSYLKEIENKFGSKAQYLFYLSVPPNASKSIIECSRLWSKNCRYRKPNC